VDAQPRSAEGKLINARWRQNLARAAAYGNFSLLDFLRADTIERDLLIELAEAVIDAGIERDELLANRIIWELGEGMKRR
jgi:hypothetical protein